MQVCRNPELRLLLIISLMSPALRSPSLAVAPRGRLLELRRLCYIAPHFQRLGLGFAQAHACTSMTFNIRRTRPWPLRGQNRAAMMRLRSTC